MKIRPSRLRMAAALVAAGLALAACGSDKDETSNTSAATTTGAAVTTAAATGASTTAGGGSTPVSIEAPDTVANVIGGSAAPNSSHTFDESPMPNQKMSITK